LDYGKTSGGESKKNDVKSLIDNAIALEEFSVEKIKPPNCFNRI
jgi:hypothetical protein